MNTPTTGTPTGTRPVGHTAARRDVALRLHPDRGGDPALFIEALRRVDEQYAATSPPGVCVQVHHTWRTRARRAVHLAMVHLRSHLPDACPGTRRYGRL